MVLSRLVQLDDEKFNFVSLTPNKIDVDGLLNKAKSRKSGAISSFLGTTREFFEDKNVTHLSYEAYEEMALDSMLYICEIIRGKWSVNNILIEHKLGDCPVLEVSVAIVISSEHRKDSLQGIEFGIDELKRIVPIWKKEFYEEGNSTWKENPEQYIDKNLT